MTKLTNRQIAGLRTSLAHYDQALQELQDMRKTPPGKAKKPTSSTPPPVPAPAPIPAPVPPAPVPAQPPAPSPPSSSDGSYPLAVINSGTQLAYDLLMGRAPVGPRVTPFRKVRIDPLPSGASIDNRGSGDFLDMAHAAQFDAFLFDALDMGFFGSDGDVILNDCALKNVSLASGAIAGGNYSNTSTARGILNYCHVEGGPKSLGSGPGGFIITRTLLENFFQQVFQVYDPTKVNSPFVFHLIESVIRRFAMNPGQASHIEPLFIQARGEAKFINSALDCSEVPTPSPNNAHWTGMGNIGCEELHVYFDHAIVRGVKTLNDIMAALTPPGEPTWLAMYDTFQIGGRVIIHAKNSAFSRGTLAYFADVGTPLMATVVDEGENFDFDTGARINVGMTPPV